jgi:hypothetical protein
VRKLVMFFILTVGALMVIVVICAGVTRADVGNAGPGPSPGLCEYPAVCGSGVDGFLIAGYYYWEDFPVELNGSHRHCEWGGGQTSGTLGFSMMVTVGATGPVGGLNGACYYVCPDMQMAAMPNPPGGWKDAIRPTKCQPIGLNPFAPPPPPQDVPISPPIAEQGAVPAAPFVEPHPPAVPPLGAAPPVTPPLAEQLPSVTNPVCPNPDATETKSC